ncbi:MAG TPA: FHA domain-containing protein [Anaerolineae bacterium]|nr:FHA domain-containing protein [Anaerolineae bacterium]HMR63944.1 FHA domain-containing protein [Anaerolineae bacterium]
MPLRLIESGELISFDGRDNLIVGRTYKEETPAIDLGPYDGKRLGISRQHIKLTRLGEQWYVEDLDSTNGTFLNGIQITPHQPTAINHGDYLRLGTMEMQFGVEG